ncbi:hyaluronidase-4 isoform X1 [Anolis carolinensis]|uniref:Hyaluronidase n=1 Tax=Anolis carolinensis TaxID=28377 RepID=G1KFN5_ANOCA|nr:PREDICTED: hyaluronidase-4 isoform X1 [Anolis carolinensis]|eukprot:XP_008103341.1 PREDICTED: hyaluronidase-4 isoform X1 [Anolis carolinensis]
MSPKLRSGGVTHNVETLCSAGPSQRTSIHLRLHKHFLLLLLLFPDLPAASYNLKPSLPPIIKNNPFLVTWNAPTARCSAAYEVPLNLDSYGILVNSQEAFAGGNITIFYYDQLGLYPYYLDTTVPPTAVNGGCPQNSSLTEHLDKMKSDIGNIIPSESFAGLSVIDWEHWRPQWIRNWDKKMIYRNMSLQLVRKWSPNLSDPQAEMKAKWEFETAAEKFMLDTLRLSQSLRPNGWWGYYLFPECYNYQYLENFANFTGHCPPLEVERNNKLIWLWENSKALYPSIYMEEVLRTSLQGKRFVWAKMGEAMRVAELPSTQHSLPVFVYARPFYTYTLKELTQTDLEYTIGQAAAMGAHGIVLWGDADYSRNRTNCLKIQEYLMSTLGPYILNVTTATKLCSQNLCNNHGRCVRRKMDSDSYLHLSPSSFQIQTSMEGNQTKVSVTGSLTPQQKDKMWQEFTCHCYLGWSGESCSSRGQGLRLQTCSFCIPGMILAVLSMWHL